jgi:hypothetical protein
MKNKQLSLDRENLADGFVLGLNPLLSLVTLRKSGSHLVGYFFDLLQDASFGASFVGCVAIHILVAVLKTTRHVLLRYLHTLLLCVIFYSIIGYLNACYLSPFPALSDPRANL